MRITGNQSGNLDPWAVSRDSTNGIGDTAQDVRFTVGSFGQPAAGGGGGWADGVYPAAMNGTTIGDLQVVAQSPTPGMAAQIRPGNAQVVRTSAGPYQAASLSFQTVTFAAADPVNPRVDYVVMKVLDPGVDSSPTTSWNPVVYQGTPAGVPTEPAGLLQDNDILLAAVTVRANTTQILGSDISDRRVFAVSRGGVVPRPATDNRAGAYLGQYRDNQTTGSLERWDGSSSWVPMANGFQWQQYTPQLYYGGNANPLGSATGGSSIASLGTGAIKYCRYSQIGKTLFVNWYFQWGTGGFNMGSGAINTLLPPGMVARPSSGYVSLTCHLLTSSPVNGRLYLFGGTTIIQPNSNVVFPAFPYQNDNGIGGFSYYVVAQSPGQPNGSIPHIPNDFAQGGYLSITGLLEIA